MEEMIYKQVINDNSENRIMKKNGKYKFQFVEKRKNKEIITVYMVLTEEQMIDFFNRSGLSNR